MKKVERKFVTERYELHYVFHAPEKSDPPGGPLARFDGIDISVLQTLIDAMGANTPYMMPYPPGYVPRRRWACPPYPPA